MSKASRKVRRQAARRRGVRAQAERRAGLVAIVAACVVVAIVGIVLVIYAITRPTVIPEREWPPFAATIVRNQDGGTVRQQIWFREDTWCARTEDRWSVSYKAADVSISKLPDGRVSFEIAEGTGDGPVPGFGENQTRAAAGEHRLDAAKIVRTQGLAGREAYVLAKDDSKTWWLDTVHGITLGYLEKTEERTVTDWKLDDLELRPSGPPWSAADAAGIDELTASGFSIVAVSGQGPEQRVIPPEQYGPFVDLAGRVFGPCKPGSSREVPEPTAAAPSPGTPPGSG